MTRPTALPPALLALVTCAVMAAGCGASEKDQFIDDYRPLNDRLLRIGKELGTSLESAEGKSNKALSEEFAAFALRLDSINGEIRALDTPGELKEESGALMSHIAASVENLEDMSGAAGNGDPQGVAAAIVELGASTRALSGAQNELAKATGARVGPG